MTVSIPILETKRLLLRPFTFDDVSDVFTYAQDPAMTKFISWAPHKNIQETEQLIQKILDKYEQKQSNPWAIVDKEAQTVIGLIEVDCDPKDAPLKEGFYMGFVLSRAYWGKGLMVEAASTVIDYLFAIANVPYVIAAVQVGNRQSERVLEKLGMHKIPGITEKFVKEQWIKLEYWIIERLHR